MNFKLNQLKSFARLVLSSAFAVVAVTACHKEEPKAPPAATYKVDGDKITFQTNAPELTSLTVQPAENRTLAITHLTGRLYWDDDLTVRIYTPVAGRVTHITSDLGDTVAIGAPLAEIDSPDFNQARANARTAVGNLAQADKAFSRSKELLAHGAAAQKDVEAAEAVFIGAQAEKDRAEAVLANYGGLYNDTNSIYTLHSPLAGVVVDKNITPGQELRADLMLANAPAFFSPLFVVSDPTQLWLQVDVAESDLANLLPGQPLVIHSPAFADKVFKGQVDKIGSTLDSTTRSIKVRGIVSNPEKLLRAEMYVLVDVANTVVQNAKAGVEIPAKAVFMKNNDSYLFIESSPGEFVRQKVVVGTERDGKVPVLDGVQAGQRVVTEGALLLQAVVEPTS